MLCINYIPICETVGQKYEKQMAGSRVEQSKQEPVSHAPVPRKNDEQERHKSIWES